MHHFDFLPTTLNQSFQLEKVWNIFVVSRMMNASGDDAKTDKQRVDNNFNEKI